MCWNLEESLAECEPCNVSHMPKLTSENKVLVSVRKTKQMIMY